jgi:hypothetical protein
MSPFLGDSDLSFCIFKNQDEVNPEMRLMLLDWICQVSDEICLKR